MLGHSYWERQFSIYERRTPSSNGQGFCCMGGSPKKIGAGQSKYTLNNQKNWENVRIFFLLLVHACENNFNEKRISPWIYQIKLNLASHSDPRGWEREHAKKIVSCCETFESGVFFFPSKRQKRLRENGNKKGEELQVQMDKAFAVWEGALSKLVQDRANTP